MTLLQTFFSNLINLVFQLFITPILQSIAEALGFGGGG